MSVPMRVGGLANLAPQSFQEAMAFAQQVASTDMVPESDRNKPGNILAKIQFGAELGLPPFQSIQKLFCTKGRVGMEVTAMQATVEGSGLCEDIGVAWDEASKTATARTTRKGRKEILMVFSHEDAVRAGLAVKDLYLKYPQRMYTRRALGFLMQDVYPDVLRGVVHAEQLYEIVGADDASALPPAPVAALLPVGTEIDPAVQATLTEAFDLCHLTGGQRTAKLAEFRGREPELLDWLRAEFAARRGAKVKGRAKDKPLALVPPLEVQVPVVEQPVVPVVVAPELPVVDVLPVQAGEPVAEVVRAAVTPVVPEATGLDLFAGASPEELFS